jgi:hypothetical protein
LQEPVFVIPNPNGCAYDYGEKFALPRGTCQRSIWNKDTKFCIVHDPGEKDEVQFQAVLKEELRQPSEIEWDKDLAREAFMRQPCDFEGWQFSGDVSLLMARPFERRVDFDDAHFAGKADFDFTEFRQGSSFTRTKFDNGVSFVGAKFAGFANFTNTSFVGDADFTESRFNGGLHFIDATFDGRAQFYAVRFQVPAVFRGVRFGTFGGFQLAQFELAADFERALFTGPANFEGANFGGQSYFSWTVFQRWCDFSNARFRAGGDFAYTAFLGTASFQNAEVRGLEFFNLRNLSSTSDSQLLAEHAQHPRALSLRNVTFQRARGLSEAVFEGVDWGRTGSRGAIIREEHDVNGEKRPEPDTAKAPIPPGTREGAEAVYRELRKSYEARKDFNRANHFYFGEMEMRRRLMPRWRRWVFSLIGLYWLSSGYGLRWRRALGWYLLLVLICGWGYAAAGLEIRAPGSTAALVAVSLQPLPSSLNAEAARQIFEGSLISFVHSLRMSVLQGEKDVYVLSAGGRGLELVQMALGPLLLLLLTLSIRRSFQR